MARNEFKFCHTLRVRYAEIDAQGVVFNAHYLTYFDVAHTEYMRATGFDYAGYVRETNIDLHLAKTVVEYKQPIVFDQEIDIYVRASRIGRSSITNQFEIYAHGTDDLLASGEKIDVCVDLSDHKPVPVPALFRQALEGFEGAKIPD